MGETKFTPEFIQHQKDLYELARLSDEFAYPVVEWQENAANVLPAALVRIEELEAEVKRLREALEMIDQAACYPADVYPETRGDYPALLEKIHEVAFEQIK